MIDREGKQISRNAVELAAMQLIQAVRGHAELHAGDEEPDDASAIAHYEALRIGLLEYRDALLDSSEWGLPFSVLDDNDDGDLDGRVGNESDIYNLEVSYLVRVLDRQRLAAVVGQSDSEQGTRRLVVDLYERDGWSPAPPEESGVELVGPWTVAIGGAE